MMADEFDPKAYLRERGVALDSPVTAPATTDAAPSQDFNPKAYLQSKAPDPTVWSGGLLPISRTASGKTFFDPLNAGITGSAVKAFTLPGRVYSGQTQVDPSNPEFIGDVVNMASTFGPMVNPMVRSGDLAAPGMRMAAKDPALAKVPTSDALIKSGQRGMDQYENMFIPFAPPAVGTLGEQIGQKILTNKGGAALPANSPELYAFLNELKKYTPQSGGASATLHVEPVNLVAMRQNLAGLFGKSTENQKAVQTAFDMLNQFMEKPPPGSTLAGSPAFLEKLGPELYAQGRGDYSAGMRIKDLENIKRTADFREAATGSDTLRSRITSHILDARKTRGYSDAEKAVLEEIPFDTTLNMFKRRIGEAMGGGGKLGATVATGVAGKTADFLGMPGPVSAGIGFATPIIGNWLKRSAGEGTEAALNRFIDMTARRSPLFQSMGRQDLVHDLNPGRDAIARALAKMPTTLQGLPQTTPQLPVLEYDPNRA